MAETSWAYTLDDGDDDSNTVPSKVTADNLKKYDISPQGQADEIRAVAEAVNNIGDNDGDGENDGLGVFYWEPAWVPVGTGGKALASLQTFKYIHTGAVTDHVFTKIDPVEITATDSDSIDAIKAQLPSEVAVHYQDGVDETETVTWQSAALDWIRGAGTYTITGTTNAGHGVTVTVTVTATPAKDYVTDGSFENAENDKNWTIAGTGASITEDSGNAADGKRALKFWASDAYSFSATQTIAGLAQKEVSSLTVTPSKTTYQVGDAIDADHDLKVVGNYSAGMGNVTLSADQFTLDYDFSAPADAAKVTVTLKSNPNVTETYTVAVTARAEGGSGNGSDGAGNGGATINPDTGEGDKTNGANGDKITGVLSNTGSAVTAVGLAVVVLGVAGGVSLALRRKRS